MQPQPQWVSIATPSSDGSDELLMSASFFGSEALSRQGTATVLAQQFDQDVLGDLGNAFNTFIQSGQIWALIVGFILGYMLRGVTTYK